ncbi:MAG: hypothetical protein QM741_13895 [Rudaea sp.]|uniref:hypothetical protein n=1 Tax=Rudaea sp. TaxID=2136325 RepID=UPI0039E4518C
MSRNTPRKRFHKEELAEELTRGAAARLNTDRNGIRQVVDAVIAYLTEEYSSTDIYIFARVRDLPVAEIRAALAAGESIRSIRRKYKVGQRTVRKILPDNCNV